MSDKKKLIFSFQGAFGPPTYGHYQSMETFITKVKADYPEHDYSFLFMPTARSGSKLHLEPTQQNRIDILREFSGRLSTEHSVHVEASIIEYGIYNDIKVTDTIYTINKIKEVNPEAVIVLGMGQDNVLQLPFWKDIEKYKELVEKIYIVKREMDGGPSTTDFNDLGGNFIGAFENKPPNWAADEDRLKPVFANVTKKVDDTVDIGTVIFDLGTVIKISLPEIVKIEAEISPSSSSMIRHFIAKIVKNIDVDTNAKKIAFLIFGPDEIKHDMELVTTCINLYREVAQTDEKFEVYLTNQIDGTRDDEYATYLNKINVTTGGKRQTRKNKRKTKRKSLKKKRKTKKKRKMKK
jgi:nicotinic acid mononucleotide adenylyltransferase